MSKRLKGSAINARHVDLQAFSVTCP